MNRTPLSWVKGMREELEVARKIGALSVSVKQELTYKDHARVIKIFLTISLTTNHLYSCLQGLLKQESWEVVPLPRKRRVLSPPGWRLRGWAEFLVGRPLYEKVFEGQFGEFEIEHNETLAAGDVGETRRIVWRYRVRFVLTLVGLVPTSATRLIVTIWKSGS